MSSPDRRSLRDSDPEPSEPRLVPSPSARFPIFSENFERCFRRVFCYVSKRVTDRASVERIVTEVLSADLDVLATAHDETIEATRLKQSADRWIARELERLPER